jgi:hypothetical protein
LRRHGVGRIHYVEPVRRQCPSNVSQYIGNRLRTLVPLELQTVERSVENLGPSEELSETEQCAEQRCTLASSRAEVEEKTIVSDIVDAGAQIILSSEERLALPIQFLPGGQPPLLFLLISIPNDLAERHEKAHHARDDRGNHGGTHNTQVDKAGR